MPFASKLLSPFVLAFLLSGCGAGPAPSPDSKSNIQGKDFSSLTSIVQANLQQLGGSAGLIVVAKDGTVLYKQYFGQFSDQTTLPIASGSKLLSAAVLMALVDEGKLSLDDSVSRYYPVEFSAPDRRRITLRQLLSHTSGLAGSSAWISSDALTLQQAVRGIGIGSTMEPPVPLPYAPSGSQFAYGGVSMHVAGGMAELASGQRWDRLFTQKIGEPCLMSNTDYQGLGPTTNFRIAGGVGTRLPDYANFLIMLLGEGQFKGKKVLTPKAVQQMLSDQTGGVPLAFTPYAGDWLREDYRYGFGCWIEERDPATGQPTVLSAQGAFGFSPWLDRKRGIGGILFVQRTLRAVNTQPDAGLAPYTLIRKRVAEILDAP